MRSNQAARAAQRAAARFRPLTRAVAAGTSLRSAIGGRQAAVAPGRPVHGGRVVDHFETDGPPLPIYDRYRYATKFDPAFYPVVGELAALARRGVLSPEEVATVDEAVGSRTLGRDLDDLRELLDDVARRRPEQFIAERRGAELRVVPDPEATEARIDALLLLRYRQLHELGFDLDRGRRLRVLEIGYTSGGHSLVAFERLGLDVTGIDNFYDGSYAASDLPDHVVRTLSRSDARLVVGDAADPTVLAGEQFDLIFSESVVEHLSRPQETFAALGRLLADGGMMIHSYEPFFCEKGGHTPGTLDCPFGHVRLRPEEHLRYLTEQRPHEAPIAVPWVRDALNRATQSDVQRAVLGAGFEITEWITHSGSPSALAPDELAHALQLHPTITTADLATTAVWFGCRPTG